MDWSARPDLADIWDAVDAVFPIRITPSFAARIDPDDPADPLGRQVLPDAAELTGPGLDDPVGEKARSPVPWVIRKHDDRLLLMVTKRCHLYCRYCFRRTHDPGDALDPTPEAMDRAIAYVASSGAREVILSGGDPLAVPDPVLFEVIDRLRPAIPVVRVHTRAPITAPARVTPALVEGLRARGPVWVLVHANHPRELAPDVDAALARLVDAGIPVLNQSVLLAGVNDSVDVLAELCEALVRRRVFPYYLHHPDAVQGTGHFDVSLERGLELYAALRSRVSGIALPNYVIDPPDGLGKRSVERYVAATSGR